MGISSFFVTENYFVSDSLDSFFRLRRMNGICNSDSCLSFYPVLGNVDFSVDFC